MDGSRGTAHVETEKNEIQEKNIWELRGKRHEVGRKEDGAIVSVSCFENEREFEAKACRK